MSAGTQPPFSEHSKLPFIGLTGAVAAGKSVALAAFENLGAATLSADAVAHDMLATGEVVDLVRDRLGEEAIVDGAVDRDAVSRIVFGDSEARKWLEAMLWPRVGARIWEWRQEQERLSPPPRALVVEVPLLFESGMAEIFDATVVIEAEHSLRRERAAARGHENLDEREARQLSAEEKAARADHAVLNDGSIAHLTDKLGALLDTIAPPLTGEPA